MQTPLDADFLYLTENKNRIATNDSFFESIESEALDQHAATLSDKVNTILHTKMAAVHESWINNRGSGPTIPSLVALTGGPSSDSLGAVNQILQAQLYCEYYIISGISRAVTLDIMQVLNREDSSSTAIIPKYVAKNGEALAYHTNCPSFRDKALEFGANIQTTWGLFTITHEGRERLEKHFSMATVPVKSTILPLHIAV